MMEKRAPAMMDTVSLFDHQSTFDKMAEHVKEAHNGDVSITKKETPIKEPTTSSYRPHDFSFMNKGK